MIVREVTTKQIKDSVRLDARFFLNSDALLTQILEDNKEKCVLLGSVGRIFNPPIFKRQFCEKESNSVMYCQSSDVQNISEGSPVYINKEQAEKVNAIVKENQILITGFGTIGNLKLVNKIGSNIAYANNVCRIEVNNQNLYGYVYAFLASKLGRAQLNKNASGTVVRYIESPMISRTLLPDLSENTKKETHALIMKANDLKVKACEFISKAEDIFYKESGLKKLLKTQYESFGFASSKRVLSHFSIQSADISVTSLNAFNYSERIKKLTKNIKTLCKCESLYDSLSDEKFFSTGSFPRIEINSPKSVKLINQSDIFNQRMDGKLIARKKVNLDNLVSYGEILIAGVGTLGENEKFGKVVFANEELEGQLVSGEFIRMKSADNIPPGYLYLWLSTDYGFRLIRSTHTGTKLCRPIKQLLANIPVPVLKPDTMIQIHDLISKAHTLRYQALENENKAISIIEKKIESWQK